METPHISVLKQECIDNLNILPGGIYVDATGGAGGHSEAILTKLNGTGRLYIFDTDKTACALIEKRLKSFSNFTIFNANFSEITEKLNSVGVGKVNGVLFDLGLSSMQIDTPERGFSYISSTNLDMRMNTEQSLTAAYILNNYTQKELADIFFKYGEEKNGNILAKKIVEHRPIQTVEHLVSICDSVNFKTKGHSAKRVFQALRIEVNDELNVLKSALTQSFALLAKNSRLCVISFHSLEDKIVKDQFRSLTEEKTPLGLPVLLEKKKEFALITKKVILPNSDECALNPRAHSAKLRVIEKLWDILSTVGPLTQLLLPMSALLKKF